MILCQGRVDTASLFAFESRTGRWYLSIVEPPEWFPLRGRVAEVQDLVVAGATRPISVVNWRSKEPALLFRRLPSNEFAIGFSVEQAPRGYTLLGTGFAFVLSRDQLNRAAAADR